MTEERRGAYAPSLDGDDDDDSGAGARRGAILLGVALIVLIAFAGVVWSAYNQGVREGGRDAPPRIAADDRPFKTVPADPGGFQTPDQDKLVYDEISGERRETEENVAPPPEEPIQRETLPAAEDILPSADDAPVEVDSADAGGNQAADVVASEPEPEPEPLTPDPEPVQILPAPAQPEPEVTAPATTSGAYLVQLAALRSEDEARATFARIRGGVGGLLDSTIPDVQRADLGERGIYYRLRVPGFATKADADAFCAELKARGQDCLTVAR